MLSVQVFLVSLALVAAVFADDDGSYNPGKYGDDGSYRGGNDGKYVGEPVKVYRPWVTLDIILFK